MSKNIKYIYYNKQLKKIFNNSKNFNRRVINLKSNQNLKINNIMKFVKIKKLNQKD